MRQSLNAKLQRIILAVLALVGIVMLSLVAWFDTRAERTRLADTEALVKRSITSKARMMVDSHALALRGLVMENAFTDLQRLVTQAVRADSEVVYGVLISSEDSPLAYSSPSTRKLEDAELDGSLKLWKELELPAGSGRTKTPIEREVKRFDQQVLEVSRPVTSDGEVVATIRYGFSTVPLREALSRARETSQDTLRATLLWIGLAVLSSTVIGFLLVARAASRIVRPLQSLTTAAESIATGKQGVRVSVHTNDELQVLAQAFNHMQAANEDAMRELSTAMEAALEASRLKSEFLANMSHEIRTPMNGVIGMIQLILKMPLEGKLRRYAETVEASAGALMTIINDVLDFSKMEAGKYTLQTAPFDPGVILQEVAELQSGRAHGKGLELVCRCAPDVPKAVSGDPDRYRQIVNNLVSNAIKFSDQGEVFVDLTLDSQGPDGAVLRTVVQDNGIGISEEDQGLLFAAFSQVDGTMVRRYGGTGLGLAISKRLAEMMGGRIGVTSSKGVGSSFWFTIRVGLSDAPVCRPPAAFPEGRRALVLEPSRRWCNIIAEHMVRWGIECDVVHDGQPALERLRAGAGDQKYDILVAAAQLRDMTLGAFVSELRKVPAAKRLPIIALTQLGAMMNLASVETEIVAQVPKPLRLSELYNSILATFNGTGAKRSSVPKMLTEPATGDKLRILVVDDNEINQFVATELVEQAGYLVDVACNGQEAVDLVESNRYAAVLMDCQMPVMDGYTATRTIRMREADGRHRTPIIALTAHAMAGEREKVLVAGMDDYLTKPLKPHSLERMLQRYIGEGEVDSEEATSLTLPALVELDPNTPRSARLSKLFIEKVPETLRELEAGVQAQDAKQIREKAHKLKGSCLAIGAEAMAKLAEALQFEAERGDISQSAERSSRLRTHYQNVASMLRRELGIASAAPAANTEAAV